ncbi:MAG: hypothetical protein KAV82_05625 [Phycisphaerae bacterium]|nr:hypothetical protein [Phycisphaerae bacterium]
MKTDTLFKTFLPTVLVVAILAGCNLVHTDDNGINGVDAIREITYSFGDSSVPPEYHRSYTITVTIDTARVVIDSYGDILADEEYEITEEQFADIKNSLETNNIRNCTRDENDGCAGGTSEGVSCSDGQSEVFSGTIYHCGGIDSGNLCGAVASFADDAKGLVPDFEELLQGTEEQ